MTINKRLWLKEGVNKLLLKDLPQLNSDAFDQTFGCAVRVFARHTCEIVGNVMHGLNFYNCNRKTKYLSTF